MRPSVSCPAQPLLMLLVGLLCGCSRPVDEEGPKRAAYVKRLAFAEDAGATWNLTARDEVIFGDGWLPTENHPPHDVRGTAWRWMGKVATLQLKASREDTKLVLVGWVPDDFLGSHPVLTFSIDGVVIATLPCVGRGWRLEHLVKAGDSRLPFLDVVIATSAVGSPVGDPRDLGAALTEIQWEPR